MRIFISYLISPGGLGKLRKILREVEMENNIKEKQNFSNSGGS